MRHSEPLGEDPGNGPNAYVYLNTIAANFAGYAVNPFGSAFGQVVGSVATYELGHYALGVGPSHTTDLGIMSRPPATTFNPSGYTYFGGFPSPFGQQFTPTQARGLFNFCQNKHGGSTLTGGGGTGNFPGNPGGQFQISGVVCWGSSEGGGCDVGYTWTTFPKQYK